MGAAGKTGTLKRLEDEAVKKGAIDCGTGRYLHLSLAVSPRVVAWFGVLVASASPVCQRVPRAQDLAESLDESHPRARTATGRVPFGCCGANTGYHKCCGESKSDFEDYGVGIVLYFKVPGPAACPPIPSSWAACVCLVVLVVGCACFACAGWCLGVQICALHSHERARSFSSSPCA